MPPISMAQYEETLAASTQKMEAHQAVIVVGIEKLIDLYITNGNIRLQTV